MITKLLRYFFWPVAACAIGIAVMGGTYGWTAGLVTLTLLILEISLSFDNAVVNARVLERMAPAWQRFFLTWGLVIPVFGVRFLGPLLLVSLTSGSSIGLVLDLALHDQPRYAELLDQAHPRILAFGGMFLLMVFLKFFFDKGKTIHWIQRLEATLVRIGKFESFEVAIALMTMIGVALISPIAHRDDILISGLIGLVLNIVITSVAEAFNQEEQVATVQDVSRGAIASLLYLELLDASFSLDGTVGAFAITTNTIVILVGLGLGALFIRTLTLLLVRERALEELIYLEHGAHYAIGALGLVMLVSINFHLPEVATGLIGLVLIALAFADSWRHRRRKTN